MCFDVVDFGFTLCLLFCLWFLFVFGFVVVHLCGFRFLVFIFVRLWVVCFCVFLELGCCFVSGFDFLGVTLCGTCFDCYVLRFNLFVLWVGYKICFGFVFNLFLWFLWCFVVAALCLRWFWVFCLFWF